MRVSPSSIPLLDAFFPACRFATLRPEMTKMSLIELNLAEQGSVPVEYTMNFDWDLAASLYLKVRSRL
jgi:hypothetical protein